MRIVVLDGYTLNPGDLSWSDFESLGDFVVYDRTLKDEILTRSRDAEILLTNKTVLSKEILNQLPKLIYIGILATGYNVVDLETASKKGIPVTNIPEYGTQSVAQMVFAHLLNLCHHVFSHNSSIKKGQWGKSPDFCYWEHPLTELSGRTMGIVGLGRIGLAVANIALSFGMKILGYKPGKVIYQQKEIILSDLKTLFSESDVVSLHCPLTESNRGMVNKEMLELMKPTAFLINTSRGLLIDEFALSNALNKGIIAGAGLDVLSEEPPISGSPLLTTKNCFITPHIAWATIESRNRLIKTAFTNLKSFVNGKMVNVVNNIN